MMTIKDLDHFVLTVSDIDKTTEFYTRILGLEVVNLEDNRQALRFGNKKINLHQEGQEITPHARYPKSGSADLCFLTDMDIEAVVAHLETCNVEILEGPVERTGATSTLKSVYINDPDGNLIEISYKQAE